MHKIMVFPSLLLLIRHPVNLKCSRGLITEYRASWVLTGAITRLWISVHTMLAMIKCLCLFALGGLVAAHPQDFLSAIGGEIKLFWSHHILLKVSWGEQAEDAASTLSRVSSRLLMASVTPSWVTRHSRYCWQTMRSCSILYNLVMIIGIYFWLNWPQLIINILLSIINY